MNLQNRLYAMFLVCLMAYSAGCATHSGVVKSPSSVFVPPGKVRLIVTRNTEALFLGVQASVDVNGERAAELWRGESYAVALEPGKVILSTNAWSTSGRFVSHFTAEADREYVFEIAPRGGHFATLSFFGVVGGAVHAAIDENTGPFSIYLKETRALSGPKN